MSTVFNLDDDPIVLVVPSSADIPPGNITESEWLAIKNRVTVVEGYGLGDLADVDASGDAGTVLRKLEDGSFAFRSVPTGIHMYNRTSVGGWDLEVDSLRSLIADPSYGIRADAGGDGNSAYLRLNFGGNGESSNVARSDHRHTQPLPTRVTTAPSGYISGGSQPLGSTSVTLSSGVGCVVEADLYGQLRGADSGAAYYTLSITIAENTYTSPGGESGFWCVQGVPDKIQWQHERRMTGTGAAVPVSASVAWHSGSGFNIDRTYLKVRVRPDR